MSFRLTEAADRDIERILQDTLELFGPYQFDAYSNLIQQALDRVGADPQGPGTSKREDVGPGVRALRLETVARRRGSASHSIYYLPPEDGRKSLSVVLRILHDRMEPKHRVVSELLDDVQSDVDVPSGRKR